MFGFKVVVLVLAAVCTAQGQHTRVKRSSWFNPFSYFGAPEEAMDTAIAAIKLGSEQLKSTVEVAEVKMVGYIEKAYEIKNETQKEAQGQVDQIVAGARDKLSKQPGSISCYEEKMAELEALCYQTTIDIASCMASKVESLKIILYEILEIGKQVVMMAPDALAAVAECHSISGTFETRCHARSAASFDAKVSLLLSTVCGMVRRGAATIHHKDSFLRACIVRPIMVVSGWSVVLVGKFALCSVRRMVGLG